MVVSAHWSRILFSKVSYRSVFTCHFLAVLGFFVVVAAPSCPPHSLIAAE